MTSIAALCSRSQSGSFGSARHETRPTTCSRHCSRSRAGFVNMTQHSGAAPREQVGEDVPDRLDAAQAHFCGRGRTVDHPLLPEALVLNRYLNPCAICASEKRRVTVRSSKEPCEVIHGDRRLGTPPRGPHRRTRGSHTAGTAGRTRASPGIVAQVDTAGIKTPRRLNCRNPVCLCRPDCYTKINLLIPSPAPSVSPRVPLQPSC